MIARTWEQGYRNRYSLIHCEHKNKKQLGNSEPFPATNLLVYIINSEQIGISELFCDNQKVPYWQVWLYFGRMPTSDSFVQMECYMTLCFENHAILSKPEQMLNKIIPVAISLLENYLLIGGIRSRLICRRILKVFKNRLWDKRKKILKCKNGKMQLHKSFGFSVFNMGPSFFLMSIMIYELSGLRNVLKLIS